MHCSHNVMENTCMHVWSAPLGFMGERGAWTPSFKLNALRMILAKNHDNQSQKPHATPLAPQEPDSTQPTQSSNRTNLTNHNRYNLTTPRSET